MANKYDTMINEKWQKLINSSKPFPNIMLLGVTSCGKSSLINRVFGKEVAYVNDTDRGTTDFKTYEGKKYNLSVNLIDSKGYELSDGKKESFEEYRKLIKKKMDDDIKADPFKKIHIIWYCISVAGAVIQDYDIEIIKMLLDDPELKQRVCVVLTKCDQDDENGSDAKAIKTALKQKTKSVIPVFEVSVYPTLPLELENLMSWSAKQLDDDDLREAFIQSQVIDLKSKRNQAGIKIAFYSAAAAAIGANPISVGVADAVLLTPLQVIMATHIIKSYGMDSLVNVTKGIVGTVLVPTLGKTLAGGLVKLIPAIGPFIGSAINGTVAASVTAALGCAISQICYTSCEKIAKGEEVDFEKAFSAENIKTAVGVFEALDKNNKPNDYISDKKFDKSEIKKFTTEYVKEHGNES
ncbi:MAG: hypothetical protein HDT48_01980 [Ruminococcaceae bacterium]|nr:hypothetical protein [Oscillospiraceae bacterium]